MKRILFAAVACLGSLWAQSQAYVKLVAQPESSPGACDASVEAVLYGTTPPYMASLKTSKGSKASGLKSERICGDETILFTMIDANCRRFDDVIKVASDPADQVILDTVMITMPTPGNNDGSLSFSFDNLPAIHTKHFYNIDVGGGTTGNTSFTGLSEGKYMFAIAISGYTVFSLTVHLGPHPTPCSYFNFEVQMSPASPPVGETSYCDGSLTLLADGELAEGYSTAFGIATPIEWYETHVNDSLPIAANLCRNVYEAFAWPDYAYYPPVITVFVQDSSDSYNIWNEPGVIPVNSDTILLSAANNCRADYSIPIDTAYISAWKLIGNNQFELTITLEQGSDSFNFYETAILDSTKAYFLDFTAFCRDSLNLTHTDHTRNIIYFEPLNTVLLERMGVFKNSLDKLQVYPNPFTDRVQVRSSKNMRSVKLYGVNGKLLQQANVQSQQYTFSTSGLPAAVYLLKVEDENGQVSVFKLAKTE